jgi:hypothetical protein
MKYLKVAGIVWGLTYFMVGALSLPPESIDLAGVVDFWCGLAMLSATLLLPLPIVLVAVWFPKKAGKALMYCVVISAVSAAVAAIAGNPSSLASNLADARIFLAIVAISNIPNLVFGIAYMRARRESMDVDPGDEEPVIGKS